jgi:hypothetical protein
VELLDLLLELRGEAADGLGLVQDEDAVGRQIVGERRAAQKAAVELQRREGVLALAQQPQVARERVQELWPQGVQVERDAERPRQHLVGRPDGCRVELLGRALRGGVEAADGVDLVAPQLDAQRLAAGREHVEDAAAAAEQARRVDQGRRLVPERQPLGRELGRRQHLAAFEHAVVVAEGPRLEHQVHGRAHGRDHQRRAGGLAQTRQALEGPEPLGELVGIVGQAVIRQRVGLGEQQHGVGIPRPGAQLVGVAARLGRSADHQQHRPAQGSLQRRQRVGSGWRDGRQKMGAGAVGAQRLDQTREARVPIEGAQQRMQPHRKTQALL